MEELKEEYKKSYLQFLGVNALLTDGLIWLTALALFCVVSDKSVQIYMLLTILASLGSFMLTRPRLVGLINGIDAVKFRWLERLMIFLDCIARGALSVGILLLAWKIIYV